MTFADQPNELVELQNERKILNMDEQAKDHMNGHVILAEIFLKVCRLIFFNELTIFFK